MVVAGSGGFTLDNSFTLIGSFNLVVTPSQFMAEVNARMLLQVQGNTLLNLQAQGGIDITNQGIYGAVQLTVNAGLPTGYGFSLNAGLLLEVNTTTSGTPTIAGITLPTGPFVEIHATGDLLVGTIDVNGTFDFTASTAGVSIALPNGNVTLGPLGSLEVGGTLKVLAAQGNVSAGLVGLIQTNVSAGSSLSNTGFAFNAHFQFEINTTNAPQQVTGFVPEQINGTYTGNVIQNQTITIQPGVMMQIGGSLTLVNLITIAGEFDVTIAPSVLMVTLDAHLSGVLGMNFNVTGAKFGIYADGTPATGASSAPGGSSSICRSPSARGWARSSSRSAQTRYSSSTPARSSGRELPQTITSSISTTPI
ncbi:MAG: hypothetical protein ACHRXM_17910 [Isosphaerales bacterium]